MAWSLFIDTQLGSPPLLNEGGSRMDWSLFIDTQLGSGDPAHFNLREVHSQ